MNVIIINKSIFTDHYEEFNSNILTNGDIKPLLHNFPYYDFLYNDWTIVYLEDLLEGNYPLLNKLILFLNSNIKRVLFYRANTLLKKYLYEIKKWENIFTIIYIDDMHDSTEIRELKKTDIRFNTFFDMVLFTYNYCATRFFKCIEFDKSNWFPHAFNTYFDVEYNDNPINKILVSGSTGKTYHMRAKFVEEKDNYPIHVLPHPGYKILEHSIVGQKYIDEINKYRIGFTCYSNSKLPYIVSKFFEIPGSGALLLAFVVDIEKELQELGFIDMENYISINKKNFKEKLEWLFDEKNNDEIERIRRNGFDFIHSHHTYTHRVIKFMDLLKDKNP